MRNLLLIVLTTLAVLSLLGMKDAQPVSHALRTTHALHRWFRLGVQRVPVQHP